MNITITYVNGKGKRVVKEFTHPMEIIGYIYRCWNSARNAESMNRIKEKLDREEKRERITEAEGGAEMSIEVVVSKSATTTPTCKESLQVGNAAKTREALGRLRDASRKFCHLILNSKYNAILDKYKYAEVREIKTAIVNANFALSAPPRNCDRQFRNAHDVLSRFTDETGRQIFNTTDVINWLIAEAKGEAE